MPLQDIHVGTGKYSQSGDEDLNGSTISDISHISQVYRDKPKQSMQYAVGLQTAIPPAIPHVYR